MNGRLLRILLPPLVVAATGIAGEASATALPGLRPTNSFVVDPVDQQLKFQLDISLWVVASRTRQSGLFAAYQQRSRWDIKNRSRPFRVESDFRPELGMTIGPDAGRHVVGSWPSWLAITAAYVHQSNGIEGDRSRGWNCMLGAIDFGTPGSTIRASIAAWYAFRVEDTNDELRRHAGDGEITIAADLSRWVDGSSLRLRSSFSPDASDGRFLTNLDARLQMWPRFFPRWALPGTGGASVDLAIDWFVGSGEFLYDYEAWTNQLRLGLAIRD